MSRRADLYALIASAFAELAQIEGGAKPAARRPRLRAVQALPAEAWEPVSELGAARAARALRRAGVPLAEKK